MLLSGGGNSCLNNRFWTRKAISNSKIITDTGTVMSFGYNSLHTAANGQELALQHTTMCIRQNRGFW